eukprot:2911739-Prymnesium_polylepis.2
MVVSIGPVGRFARARTAARVGPRGGVARLVRVLQPLDPTPLIGHATEVLRRRLSPEKERPRGRRKRLNQLDHGANRRAQTVWPAVVQSAVDEHDVVTVQ